MDIFKQSYLPCISGKIIFYFLGEAEAKYGKDKIKMYTSDFTPMYFSVTTRKEKCQMKLICALPEEKVFFVNEKGLNLVSNPICYFYLQIKYVS